MPPNDFRTSAGLRPCFALMTETLVSFTSLSDLTCEMGYLNSELLGTFQLFFSWEQNQMINAKTTNIAAERERDVEATYWRKNKSSCHPVQNAFS